MAGKPLIEVRGAKRFRATMRQAGVDMARMKEAHAAAARIAAAGVKSAAPSVTGKLKSTIRSSGTMSAGIVRAGFKATPYPGPVNWGWPEGSGPRGDFGGDNFITAGAKATEPQWVAAYEIETQKIIDTIEGL